MGSTAWIGTGGRRGEYQSEVSGDPGGQGNSLRANPLAALDSRTGRYGTDHPGTALSSLGVTRAVQAWSRLQDGKNPRPVGLGSVNLQLEVAAPAVSAAALAAEVERQVKAQVGVTIRCQPCEPGSLPRSEGGKLRRVTDLRQER